MPDGHIRNKRRTIFYIHIMLIFHEDQFLLLCLLDWPFIISVALNLSETQVLYQD